MPTAAEAGIPKQACCSRGRHTKASLLQQRQAYERMPSALQAAEGVAFLRLQAAVGMLLMRQA
jgi:hypothetical protein